MTPAPAGRLSSERSTSRPGPVATVSSPAAADTTVPGRKLDEPMNSATNRDSGRSHTSRGRPTWRTLPSCMTAIFEDSASASVWSWVTYTDVTPSSRCSRLSSNRRLSRSLASRLDSGSSSSSSGGGVTSARASASRCCWPPDSLIARRPT